SGQDFAVLAERRRISRLASGTGFISAHIADEQAGFGSRFGQALKELEILRDELCLEQQIAWRISAGSQLRKHYQVRPGLRRPAIGGKNLAFIAWEITHGSVDLGERDFHSILGTLNHGPDIAWTKPAERRTSFQLF